MSNIKLPYYQWHDTNSKSPTLVASYHLYRYVLLITPNIEHTLTTDTLYIIHAREVMFVTSKSFSKYAKPISQ